MDKKKLVLGSFLVSKDKSLLITMYLHAKNELTRFSLLELKETASLFFESNKVEG